MKHWDRNELTAIVDASITRNLKISGFETDIARLETKVARLEADVATLKDDVATLKDDVATLKADVKRIEARLDLIEARLERVEAQISVILIRLDRLEHCMFEMAARQEDMERNIKLILDAVLPAQRRGEAVKKLEVAVEQHEVRLDVVETVVGEHLRDDQLHRS